MLEKYLILRTSNNFSFCSTSRLSQIPPFINRFSTFFSKSTNNRESIAHRLYRTVSLDRLLTLLLVLGHPNTHPLYLLARPNARFFTVSCRFITNYVTYYKNLMVFNAHILSSIPSATTHLQWTQKFYLRPTVQKASSEKPPIFSFIDSFWYSMLY